MLSRTLANPPPFDLDSVGNGATNQLKLESLYVDEFDRDTVGPDWTQTSDKWHLKDGRLCTRGTRNHPIWLNRSLPTNARIEFTAESLSAEGDIKVEAWGNGRAFAHGTTYDDATSYVFIFGGWKNSLHVLARLNEHGSDRLELKLDETTNNPRNLRVKPNVRYRFIIERNDGHTVHWSVDNHPLLSLDDEEPLTGSTHEHFAFNGWEAEVCFDSLRITPLAE
jgi:hypothetical protein